MFPLRQFRLHRFLDRKAVSPQIRNWAFWRNESPAQGHRWSWGFLHQYGFQEAVPLLPSPLLVHPKHKYIFHSYLGLFRTKLMQCLAFTSFIMLADFFSSFFHYFSKRNEVIANMLRLCLFLWPGLTHSSLSYWYFRVTKFTTRLPAQVHTLVVIHR